MSFEGRSSVIQRFVVFAVAEEVSGSLDCLPDWVEHPPSVMLLIPPFVFLPFPLSVSSALSFCL